VGWGPGSPSPSYLLGRRPPASPRSEMPALTKSGRNRPTLVNRLPEGASSRHDAATAVMARPSGTRGSTPMSQLADRMERSELLSHRSELDPAYITDSDLEMASHQTCIESPPPDQRQEQETWAQEKLEGMPTTCPYRFESKRAKVGYRCAADICFVTDELLAEGKEYRCPPTVTLPQFGPAYPMNTRKAHKNYQILQTRSSSSVSCSIQ
jgi:hypothetical protein